MKSKMSGLLLLVLFLPAAQCSTDLKKHTHTTENFTQVMERDTIINRPPAVAGTFYPASPAELKSTLDKLFLSSTPNENLNNIAAIISPHAGYVYSGTVA